MPISIIPAPATPVNLHSPGPFGDVTPNTVGSTIITLPNGKTITADAFQVILNTALSVVGGIAIGNINIVGAGSGGNTMNLSDGFGSGVNIVNGILRITGIPTSSAGRASGDVYSNLGVLTIVA